MDFYGDVHGSATRLVVRQKLPLDVVTKSFRELAGIILTVFRVVLYAIAGMRTCGTGFHRVPGHATLEVCKGPWLPSK